MLHILMSDQHWNNRVTESDERLNEIRHTYLTNLDAQIVHFMILFVKMARLLLSLNQEIGYDQKTLR